MNEAMDSSVKTVVLQPTPRQDEETLWQSGELGYHSPEALTQTLVMIIVKHLKIRSSQAHRFHIKQIIFSIWPIFIAYFNHQPTHNQAFERP